MKCTFVTFGFFSVIVQFAYHLGELSAKAKANQSIYQYFLCFEIVPVRHGKNMSSHGKYF